MNNVLRKKKSDLESNKCQILEMANAGQTVYQIAKHFGASVRGISMALGRWGGREATVSKRDFANFMLSKEQVLKDRREGMNRTQIAAKYKVNVSTVAKYMKLWGEDTFVKRIEVDKDMVVELRKGGLSLREIAEKMGVCQSTISKILKKVSLSSSRRFGEFRLPKVILPDFREGETYTIDGETFVFQRLLKSARPMAVFADAHGRTTTFTDLQLVNVKGDAAVEIDYQV